MRPDEANKQKILNRLKRARGQMDAVIAAVENEDSCRNVVTQLSAVSSALDRAGFLIVATAMKDCFDETAEGSDDVTPEELEKLFMMLA